MNNLQQTNQQLLLISTLRAVIRKKEMTRRKYAEMMRAAFNLAEDAGISNPFRVEPAAQTGEKNEQ